ncbi:MAG TPA: peptidylprolyl isomerase [Kofleriaceae bacterium]|nr:peptidylprolyl isomerase [Kofleriaceae bacterium]
MSGSAAPKPNNGELPAEPVGKQPSPNPAPAGDDVRPPTAADLDAYTKDIPGTGKLGATFDTSLGAIHCELYPDKTPATVANFVGLATGKKPWLDPRTGAVQKGKPYYDGLTFHRVIADFSNTGAMIQGGDPTATGGGGPGYDFDDEIAQDLKMSPGVLAMANAGKNPSGGGTNGSQFFIIEGSPSYLNGKHTIFGKCKEIEVVKKIAGVPQNADNKPNDPVTIKSVTISKQGSWL